MKKLENYKLDPNKLNMIYGGAAWNVICNTNSTCNQGCKPKDSTVVAPIEEILSYSFIESSINEELRHELLSLYSGQVVNANLTFTMSPLGEMVGLELGIQD